MFGFSWKKWTRGLIAANSARTLRRPRLTQVEGLENRALLTANLPVAVDDAYVMVEGEKLAGISVLENDTDADGDKIKQVVLESDVSHGTLKMSKAGRFVYTPDPGFVGTDTFTYLARDVRNKETSAEAATVTITVTGSDDDNTAPTVSDVTLSTVQDNALTGTLAGTDAEGDTLSFAEGATPATNGTVVINEDGTFSFTPTPGFSGVATFSYNASDDELTSDDATVTINVVADLNTAPTVNAVSLTTTIDTAVSGTLSGADLDGDPLTFSEGATTATNGTVVINADGTYTFTPNAGFTGIASFTYKASDGELTSSDAVVTVNVSTEPNTAPTVSDLTLTAVEGSAITGTLTAADSENDTLTFAEGTTAETNGTVQINPDGTFTFTPTSGFSGTATFTFNASDVSLTSSDATVTIIITPDESEGDLEIAFVDNVEVELAQKQPTVLDSSASLISVPNDADLSNATLTVHISAGADKKDRLSINETADVDVRGKSILIDGIVVANISTGKKGDTLEVTFTQGATEEQINAVLQSIAIETKAKASSGDRTINVELSAGELSATDSIIASVS